MTKKFAKKIHNFSTYLWSKLAEMFEKQKFPFQRRYFNIFLESLLTDNFSLKSLLLSVIYYSP